MNKYLQFGKYTKNCPQWLLDKVRNIKKSDSQKEYILKILEAIREEFNPEKYKPEDCQKQAEKFSKVRFKKEILELILKATATFLFLQ